MINNKHNSDDFLRDLVQKSNIDSPSVNFTQKVMESIESESIVTEKNNVIFGNLRNWLYLATGFTIAIAYLVYYYISSSKTFLTESFDPLFLPIFEKLFLNFKELVGSFQISSFTLVIIVAIASLFLLDRLLRKFQTGKNVYFSF